MRERRYKIEVEMLREINIEIEKEVKGGNECESE